MEKFAPKFSKVLLTPDPHYVPGYTGYCPQLKFNMGRTYSQHTAELLTSPDVKHSGRLVLHGGHVPSTDTHDALTPRGVPDSNLKKPIPGYTGFIPRSQNYFSCSFSETCCKAQAEFQQERRARAPRRSTHLPVVVNCTSQPFDRPKRTQTTISNKEVSFKPLTSFTTISPYSMEDDNQHKYFISGFAGHVPKYRYLIGRGFPIITNQALIDFGKQQQSDPTLRRTAGTSSPMLPTIYPSKGGVVPSFTGHIPGHRFMFGHTFGQLSREALEKRRIGKLLREKP
uniref:Ciliary microtubule inner protein 2B n=1 Tax=Scophthalmus maximus TaxID=52904 RepID=A0A8D3BEY1_SCOMX